MRESNPRSAIEKTSRLIFLNRTCFNGLYRVNSKGKFNVPLGKYSNPNIVNEENLRAVSHMLQSNRISITCRDFEAVLRDAKKGDLVYFDPPYQPVSSTANFTSYTNKDFTYDDLTRLAELCLKLDSRGCKVLLSNSDSKEVADIFSKNPWKITKIEANRSINSNSKKRTGHFELLIKNY
jgi:DNA adenine methylase